MPRPASLLTLLLPALAVAQAAAPDIFVAYPPAEYRVEADHVILEGSVTPGATLTVGGKPVKVGPDGLFMEWWPLKPGLNDLRLVARSGSQSGAARLRVTRTVQSVLPARPTAIDRASLSPREDVEFWDIAGDTPAERRLTVSLRGTPGGKASASFPGLPAQTMTEGPAGMYAATLNVPASSVKNAAISVRLTGRDGKTAAATAPGRLSVASDLTRTGVQKAGTIPGPGINDAVNSVTDLDGHPLLYPRGGMTFALVGRQGRDVRARLSPGLSVLITASQLSITPGAPAPVQVGTLSSNGRSAQMSGGMLKATAPQTPPPAGDTAPATAPAGAAPAAIPALPTGNTPPADAEAAATAPVSGFTPAPPAPITPAPATSGDSTLDNSALGNSVLGDWQLRVPLGGARIPFTLNQSGPGQLTLNLYGLAAAPQMPLLDDFLRGVQRSGSGLVLNFNTTQLWGFTARYDGPDLLLTVRRPPALNPARPLEGRVITLDPGHGGTQFGGAGALRVPEKDIVLPIALRAAQLLREAGATVNLTRTGDVTLGLYERDLNAEASKSDLLLSIHANALPDGHDPRGIRGPEVHFTHQQAREVSAAILNQIRTRLPELGAGKGLMPGANLALTRPTTQISLLVETAYLTDAGNLRVLMSPDGRERFAQAIAGGVVDFYRAQAGK